MQRKNTIEEGWIYEEVRGHYSYQSESHTSYT